MRDVYVVIEVAANYSAAGIPIETMWTYVDYVYLRRVFTLDPNRFPLRIVQSWLTTCTPTSSITLSWSILLLPSRTVRHLIEACRTTPSWSGPTIPSTRVSCGQVSLASLTGLPSVPRAIGAQILQLLRLY